MSIAVYELATSRDREIAADSASVDLKFIAAGSTNDALIYPAIIAVSPKTYTVLGPAGLPVRLRRQSVKLHSLGADYWEATVPYGFKAATADDTSDDPDTDDVTPLGIEWNFDTTGGTQHITQSLRTLSKVGQVGGAAAPDYKQAINVTRDSVGGTDIIAPKLEFSATAQKQSINLPYLRGLARTTGKTNSKKWYGFEIGEVLYLGASGNAKPGERFSVTHKFTAGENLTGVVVRVDNAGGTIGANGLPQVTGAAGEISVNKKAWEYLWCAYIDVTSNNILIQLPVAAYVEQVYRSADFGAIFN